MKSEPSSPKLAVVGLGYVGCVSAACFAKLGFHVVGIDRDEHKVQAVLEGVAPFFEPGLAELVREAKAAGRLTASRDILALHDADIALVCVGTPSEKNGDLGLEQLRRVCTEIARTLPARNKPLTLVIRSTVFPGTCEEVVLPALHSNALPLVFHPEFLREGAAVKDFMEPSLVVVGSSDAAAAARVAALYQSLNVPVSLMDLRSAEMIKYACNAFHAVKTAFANEIGALSARCGVHPGTVMETLCKDVRLNISPAYLKPGFAFGGSCLPKDLRAINYRAQRLDLRLPLLESALPSNSEHLKRAIEAVLNLPERRIGIIGLAFKEQTDDLRESPVITLVETLIGKGRQIRIFDPQIQLDAIYGSNRDHLLSKIPHIGAVLDGDIGKTIGWADHLVIAQNLPPQYAARVQASGRPVINLVAPELAYLRDASGDPSGDPSRHASEHPIEAVVA
jgi:GDP-mannose 6-dehydrogenase